MSELKNTHIEQIELRSDEVQELLTKIPHWMIRWGNVLFLALILLLLFISWFVKYPDIITSEALITTQIPPQREYSKITGKLEAILVDDNQEVKKNQALAILENTASYMDVFKLKTVLDTIQVHNKTFQFPIDKLPLLFLGDIEPSFAMLENNYILYKLNKELKPYSYEAIANESSISELESRLRSLNSQKQTNKIELGFTEKDLLRNKKLFDKGVISEQDYENKQLEFAQAQRNHKNFEASISQIREGISNAKRASKGTDINQVKEEIILHKNVIQSFVLLKKAVKDWEYQYVLQSSINGKVAFLNYWNINQTVKQGDLVFTIIPSKNSSFIAKLKTPALNSGKIKIDQTVNIKLKNYPYTEFGLIKGKIKSVSLMPDKEGFYLINVSLPEKLITSYNKPIKFKQEMTGTAEIITEDLRLMERFYYQFSEVMKR